MNRPGTKHFVSFLDQFEERIQLDCEQLKLQLIAQVDGGFKVLRETVRKLRNRFGSVGQTQSAQVELPDDPPVETVSLEQWIQECTVATQLQQASTSSTGRKRKGTSGANAKKKRKYVHPNPKYTCKFVGCGRAFTFDINLAQHERIHLSTKPFVCTWPGCCLASRQRGNLVKHIRGVHFKLDITVERQQQLNMVDERDPNKYIRVDTALLNRHQS